MKLGFTIQALLTPIEMLFYASTLGRNGSALMQPQVIWRVL